MGRHGTTTVFGCFRNEGLFLLEWVAYYRALGFDRQVFFTNACRDGSDLMLDRLQEMGWVRHVRNDDFGPEGPQARALHLAKTAVPETRDADWVLHVDSDEFLVVHHGAHRIDDLLDVVAGYDTCAIAWRPFGDGGHEIWPGGLVIEAFTQCDKKPFWNSGFHKPLFKPARFQRFGIHMPKAPLDPQATQCVATGDAVETTALYTEVFDRHRHMERDKLTWDGACIHHYAIRSQDVFLMKNDRGDVTGKAHTKYFKNSTYWRRYNTNRRPNTDAVDYYADDVKGYLVELRTDPMLAALERVATIWFETRRDRVLTPERVAEWTLPEDVEHQPFGREAANEAAE